MRIDLFCPVFQFISHRCRARLVVSLEIVKISLWIIFCVPAFPYLSFVNFWNKRSNLFGEASVWCYSSIQFRFETKSSSTSDNNKKRIIRNSNNKYTVKKTRTIKLREFVVVLFHVILDNFTIANIELTVHESKIDEFFLRKISWNHFIQMKSISWCLNEWNNFKSELANVELGISNVH